MLLFRTLQTEFLPPLGVNWKVKLTFHPVSERQCWMGYHRLNNNCEHSLDFRASFWWFDIIMEHSSKSIIYKKALWFFTSPPPPPHYQVLEGALHKPFLFWPLLKSQPQPQQGPHDSRAFFQWQEMTVVVATWSWFWCWFWCCWWSDKSVGSPPLSVNIVSCLSHGT